jgi:transcriptional regulator with XRE-family HTH domain
MLVEKGGSIMTEKIYKLRKELSLTQDEFGAMLSVSIQAVSKWELGQSTPDLATLRKMKQVFNVSYDELLEDDKIIEHNSDLIVNLRNKRTFFYYSIMLIVISLLFFLYYITIRLNGYYDGFILKTQFELIQSQQGYDWFYYFITTGLLAISTTTFLFGLLFIYLSQRKNISKH